MGNPLIKIEDTTGTAGLVGVVRKFDKGQARLGDDYYDDQASKLRPGGRS